MIQDLHPVVMDVPLVDEHDVLGGAVVPAKDLYVVVLYPFGFLDDSIVRGCYARVEEDRPLPLREFDSVQQFQLSFEVRYEVGFIMYPDVFVTLFTEHPDELGFQCRFRLIRVGFLGGGSVLRHDGALVVGCYDVV